MSIFLPPDELATLTGIRSGRRGKTREERQIDALKKMKIPHYVNAARRPVVARAVIEGASSKPPQEQGWEPGLSFT